MANPLTVPWNAEAKSRDRGHQQLVAAILNSLLYQGYIVMTGVDTWQLANINPGPVGATGQPGPPGQAGSAWSSGTGTPSPNQGRLNDFYFRSETGQVYQKLSLFFGVPPTWVLIARLPPRGQQGLQGIPGQPGAPGLPGAQGVSGASGGGAFSLISTQVASASNFMQWTGLVANDYILYFDNIQMATDQTKLAMQFGQGSSPTWETAGGYQWAGFWARASASTGANSGVNDTSMSLVAGRIVGNLATYGVSGEARIHSLATNGVIKMVESDATIFDDVAITRTMSSGYWNNDTNIVTAVRLLAVAGTITSGTASLYMLTN